MTPCERCDFIGPELPSVVRDAREMHRAMHGLMDVFMGPVWDWQIRVLDRMLEARAMGVSTGASLTLPRRKWGRP